MSALLEATKPATDLKPARPAKPKILLVDDDPAIRQLLMRLLAEEGYYVLTAANGVEALVSLESMHFDLVLLDLNLPRSTLTTPRAFIRQIGRPASNNQHQRPVCQIFYRETACFRRHA